MNELCRKLVTGIKGIWVKTDPNLPGAKQKTPLNIPRFYLLLIILIYTATSACIYFDWSATRNLLLKAGKYAHLNEGTYNDIKLSLQYKKINTLYPITLAIHFTGSVFCGFLYDHVGPKFTAILGQLFNIICWICLSIDSKVIDTTFIGFIFLGLGADTAFIPILTISNLYPDLSTFILTVIGSAASLSFAVPAILNLIFKHFNNISFSILCYGYILVILVPCTLIAIFLLPLRPFKGLDYYMESMNNEEQTVKDAITLNNSNEQKPKLENDTPVKNIDKIESTSCNIYKSNSHEKIKTLNDGLIDVNSNKNKNVQDLIMCNKYDKKYHTENVTLFFKVLISYPCVCIITYFILFNVSAVFYGMINETYFEYDTSIITIINILVPISCIPCIIFGRFINKYGAAPIILLMNALSALMHATALIKYKIAGLFSIVFYMCVASMYTSQIYCYIQNAFPSIIFGKLLGFSSMCGGFFSLVCEILYNSSIKKKNTTIDPTNVSITLVILFLIMFFPLSILYNRKYEKCISEKKEANTIII